MHEHADMLGCCVARQSGTVEVFSDGYLQVSRVLKLPIPAKSTQLLGKDFVGEEGRGANLIDIGNGVVVVRASLSIVQHGLSNGSPWPALPMPAIYTLFTAHCVQQSECMSSRWPSAQAEHLQPCDMKTGAAG